MSGSTKYLVDEIKKNRIEKELSQRALSAKTGTPQAHISNIEKGSVDLQVSKLIELARALDLEVMLVPRQLVPAFESLKKNRGKKTTEPTPMYQLDEEEDG